MISSSFSFRCCAGSTREGSGGGGGGGRGRLMLLLEAALMKEDLSRYESEEVKKTANSEDLSV